MALPAGGWLGAQQSLGPSTGGLEALDQALRFLGHHHRVLMVAAHPDDEDTELLTILARGLGAEAAYLSLTRGEGGQNLIGRELGPGLGVLRSEELLAARRLDGARQYFTRAYDFGFSKSLADTWRFWPRDSVLKDVVRVIRRFRPQVMVAIFSGTPRDGHGQHQASGWAAREAFQAAADPARFPELASEEGLAPWQPLKLYQTARFDGGGPVLTLEGGVIDRAVGQSFLQIAMRGRSLHRSQDMGSAQRIGPSQARLRLVEDRTGQPGGGLFAGIDTSLAGLLPPGRREASRSAAASLAARFRALTPLAATDLPVLRRELLSLLGPESSWLPEARDQVLRLDAAVALASGILCDAVTATDRVAPGGTLAVVLSCWNTGSSPSRVGSRLMVVGRPADSTPTRDLAPGVLVSDTLSITVPREARPTSPYYLSRPAPGSIYDWPGGQRATWGDPFEAPPFMAEFTFGDAIVTRREVVQRIVDQAVGEVRRPVFVVPELEVGLEPASGLWPADGRGRHRFTVRLRSNAARALGGSATLSLPAGWAAVAPQAFRLEVAGRDTTLGFEVVAPATAGRFEIEARVSLDGEVATGWTLERVEYPHTRPRHLLHPARSVVSAAEVTRAGARRVGYVRGAADRIPEALASLGLNLVLLNRDSLAKAELANYQTIVIGPRAYETEPALLAFNARLLGFVAGGGTLVVQYQQQPYFQGGFAPFMLSLTEAGADPRARVANARVAEEDAEVRVLEPSHPVLRAPNPIGADDWRGWVQERGLYFPRRFGPEWSPILEMADAGEPPLRGSLLVARHGRGTYVYTGLSFFRQLPAAVPGAARLFVNLLSLGH